MRVLVLALDVECLGSTGSLLDMSALIVIIVAIDGVVLCVWYTTFQEGISSYV